MKRPSCRKCPWSSSPQSMRRRQRKGRSRRRRRPPRPDSRSLWDLVGSRFQNNRRAECRPERGSMSLQLLILLVPVIFGLMGFALDLGRLWLIRGELNQAANAMALAAAGQIALGQDMMQAAANLALNETNGNRYNFGSTVIPSGTVTCFAGLDSASQNDLGATTACGPGTFVQASISVPAPLLFWSLLPGGSSRTTTVASS